MPPLDAVKLAAVPPFARLIGVLGICAVVASVPDVGNVTDVVFDMVNVVAKVPDVVRAPPRVNVLASAFAMPVPPDNPFKTFGRYAIFTPSGNRFVF